MERKAIQIIKGEGSVIALCDDGAMFSLKMAIDSKGARYVWSTLPAIPQPKVEAEDAPVYERSIKVTQWFTEGYAVCVNGGFANNPYDVFNEGDKYDEWAKGAEAGRVDFMKRAQNVAPR